MVIPIDTSLQLVAYSDVDWAGCPDTRRSCKKQDRVSKSSTEAEYRAMSTACSEIVWLRGLLEELGFPQTTTPLHPDNTSAIQVATNPVILNAPSTLKLIVLLIETLGKSGDISSSYLF